MIALTDELVDLLGHQIVAPPAIASAAGMTEEEVNAICENLISNRPDKERLHVFAYGSLLWKPAFEPDAEEPAIAPGWHRAFRMRQTSWRGSPDNPGLMMVLDRGGSCRGIALSVKADRRRAAVKALIRREMSSRSTANQPRWISIDVQGRRETALAFCIDRTSAVYAGRQSEDAVANMLARAVGPAGSCAEYLLKTVNALEERKIRDRNLIRLQSLVAQRIVAAVRN